MNNNTQFIVQLLPSLKHNFLAFPAITHFDTYSLVGNTFAKIQNYFRSTTRETQLHHPQPPYEINAYNQMFRKR